MRLKPTLDNDVQIVQTKETISKDCKDSEVKGKTPVDLLGLIQKQNFKGKKRKRGQLTVRQVLSQSQWEAEAGSVMSVVQSLKEAASSSQ